MGIDDASRFAVWASLAGHEHALCRLEAVPLIERGEVVAIGSLDGTEIHFAISPEWRGRLITRRRIKEYLTPLISRLGFLTTRSVGRSAFAERVGFEKTRETKLGDDTIWHYMMTEPLARRK